ncbi:MAG: sugar ABC transporter substrate-binding protein [Armatimonadota bacterium]|jgi:multiple sugar transport system substrate-binding protein
MKKSLIIFGLLTFVILALAGCSSQPQKKEVVVMWWGDAYNAAFAQKLIDAYNATKPEVPAKLIAVPHQSYNSKLLSQAASKTLPDIILLYPWDAQIMGSKAVLLPLNKYTDQQDFAQIKKDMWPRLLSAVTVNGNVYAVPIWTWSPGIYYNKDMFDAAGVEYPSKNWTWDEFIDKARKLTKKKNGRIVQYGLDSIDMGMGNFMLSYLVSNGGTFLSPDGTKCLLSEPKNIAILEKYFEMELKDGIAPKSSARSNMTQDVFTANGAAMRIGGRDGIDVLTKRGMKFNWGAAPMPRGTKIVPFQTAMNLAISASTKYPDGAWAFVKFASGEPGQKVITQDRSDITVLKPLTYSKGFEEYKGRKDVNCMYRDMLIDSIPYPTLLNQWKSRIKDEFGLVEAGFKSVEKACQEISREFKPAITK